MTTSASRRARSARNVLAEALGLGETYPLRDLPVKAEPPVAAYGAIARVAIEDSERAVDYQLRDQDGKPLPNGAGPGAAGTGAELPIDTPKIKEDIRFTVRAATSSGRSAMLFGNAEVRVGLDDSLPATVVPPGPVPCLIDFGSKIEVEVQGSQEGVTYRLVARPQGDSAAPDDPAAIAADILLSMPKETAGTGGAIRLKSTPLTEDTTVRVRAVKTFGGNKPTQTTLLKTWLALFVRPQSELAVSVKPAVVNHGGESEIRIASAAAGVDYSLYGRPIADSEFSRADPSDPAALEISTPDGPIRVVPPKPTQAWTDVEGFEPLGEPASGAGSALSIPVPALEADMMILIQARKRHVSGPEGFESAERLDQPAAVLVRPNPKPPLRLAASLADGKMIALSALSGQAGVFYSVSAGRPLGELYLHQKDARETSLNKGVGALAVAVDLVVAGGSPAGPTSAAPPPLPTLETAPIALPVQLKVSARRAMTNLTADVGKVSVSALPAAEIQPAAVAPGKSAKLVIAQPVPGELYAVSVDGRLIADPVAGADAPLALATGPLQPGARVELWAQSTTDSTDSIQIERLAPLTVAIG